MTDQKKSYLNQVLKTCIFFYKIKGIKIILRRCLREDIGCLVSLRQQIHAPVCEPRVQIFYASLLYMIQMSTIIETFLESSNDCHTTNADPDQTVTI